MDHTLRTRINKILAVVFFLTLCPSTGWAKLNIVTTTEDLASITRTLAGELATVTGIAKGSQDPHYVEAKPSFLVLLSRADLVLSIGLSLESGWLPLLLRGARRPNLLPGAAGYLSVSEAIAPLEVHSSGDRSQGDVHPEGNPHFMADPERGLVVAERISKKLAEIDPQHTVKYQENFARFKTELQNKITEWSTRLAKYRGMKVIGYHKTFNYFFNWARFEEIGYLEPKPGIPPTVQHILKLTELMKAKKVKLIIVEDFFDPKPGKTLAERTGAQMLLLPAYVGGDERVRTYIDWIELLVTQLEGALK